ncbi:29675_t:CDS:2, partial [Racocetra persica]
LFALQEEKIILDIDMVQEEMILNIDMVQEEMILDVDMVQEELLQDEIVEEMPQVETIQEVTISQESAIDIKHILFS